MSKTTLRKRIAVIAVSALTVGMLSVASPAANATHPSVGGASGTNADAFALSKTGTGGTLPSGTALFVATQANSGSTSAAATHTAGPTTAFSKGLLSKDTSSGTAQSAVVLQGGVLSLYAVVSTAVTFSASAGSFGSLSHIATAAAGQALFAPRSFPTYNSNNSKAWLDYIPGVAVTAAGSNASTGVAVLWTAPTTAGTYTVSMSTGYVLGTNSTTYSNPSSSNGDSPTLVGNITVSVVAASAGGSYSAAYSSCRTQVNTATSYNSLVASFAPGVDSTGTVKNGDQWTIDFDLNDAYAADLDSGNIVVSATNGALVKLGTAGSTPVAGTTSTDVTFGSASARTVRIDQPTAGAPLTTTVTITYNGTNVCTKTVSIGGKVAKIAVANVGTQALSTALGSAQWMYQEIGLYSAGLFTILATDSAGNIVDTNGLGTFSADSATLTTVVQAASFPTLATSRSSSSPARFSLGSFQCGAVAGSANIKVKFTTSSSGESVTSDAFAARCADVPSTYTVSLDKASYTQGQIATATVQFLDSKGNKANSVTAVGANSWILPYFSPVTMTGTLAQGASATAVTKADGTSVLVFTVGTTTSVVNGSYAGVVAYDSPALGVKQTPAYSLSTGGDSTTNADVLKSIVALIASINKQIQALQKLILARR
jgi:hypothetical protein